MLVLTRFMIGFGLSACWTGAYKANTLWWPRERLPLVNAITIAAAGLGSLAATSPTEWLLRQIGWREIFLGLAGVTATIALIIATVVPPQTRERAAPEVPEPAVKGLRGVLTHPAFLTIAPASASVREPGSPIRASGPGSGCVTRSPSRRLRQRAF